jgi:hypothetical protein
MRFCTAIVGNLAQPTQKFKNPARGKIQKNKIMNILKESGTSIIRRRRASFYHFRLVSFTRSSSGQ